MRDILKSQTGFNPNTIEDPENIKHLYVGHNELEEIDFLRFKNLEALDIGHNKIKDISKCSGINEKILKQYNSELLRDIVYVNGNKPYMFKMF